MGGAVLTLFEGFGYISSFYPTITFAFAHFIMGLRLGNVFDILLASVGIG